jgi:hypothetical protein
MAPQNPRQKNVSLPNRPMSSENRPKSSPNLFLENILAKLSRFIGHLCKALKIAEKPLNLVILVFNDKYLPSLFAIRQFVCRHYANHFKG